MEGTTIKKCLYGDVLSFINIFAMMSIFLYNTFILLLFIASLFYPKLQVKYLFYSVLSLNVLAVFLLINQFIIGIRITMSKSILSMNCFNYPSASDGRHVTTLQIIKLVSFGIDFIIVTCIVFIIIICAVFRTMEKKDIIEPIKNDLIISCIVMFCVSVTNNIFRRLISTFKIKGMDGICCYRDISEVI